MANSLTNYSENLILNSIFGGATLTPPSTLYFGLSTTSVQDDGSGITEPIGNGYTRVGVANNITLFPTTTTSAKSNGSTVSFPSASGSWGNIKDFFVSDSAINGNIICYGTLSISKDVTSGDILSFGVGNLTITLD